jgi:hypothetical protein
MTRLCSRCRTAPRRTNHRYCAPCFAAYQREYRRSRSLSPKQRLRGIARAYARVYHRRGELPDQPCEACGATPAEMHHDDYSRPLDVRWLCRPHHLALHAAHPTTPQAPQP